MEPVHHSGVSGPDHEVEPVSDEVTDELPGRPEEGQWRPMQIGIDPQFHATYLRQIHEFEESCVDNAQYVTDSSMSNSESESDTLSECSESDDINGINQEESCDKARQQFLYNGSSVDIKTAMILLLSFVTRHKLAGVVLEDLLSLFNIFCPGWNLKISKLYSFIEQAKYAVEKHYYCSNCQFYIPNPDTINICPVPGCEAVLRAKDNSLSYFIILPLVPQVKELCERKDTFSYMFGNKRHVPSSD